MFEDGSCLLPSLASAKANEVHAVDDGTEKLICFFVVF
jgi:hypothetical protein